MTFDEWWESQNSTDEGEKYLAKKAWEFQQEHIEVLAETIEDFEKEVRKAYDRGYDDGYHEGNEAQNNFC